MKSLGKMIVVEFKLFLRQPLAAFFTLVFPLFLLFLFGSIYGNEPVAEFGNRGSVDVSVPGYMAMIIATGGLMHLSVLLATYREQGILRRYQASPLSVRSWLAAQLVVHTATAVAGSALLLGAGVLLYDLALPASPGLTILAFVLGSLSFAAIGFMLAGVLPTARTATAVGTALLFPMMFLSGASLPRQILPENVARFGDILPLTYVVNLIQDAWHGGEANLTALAVVIGVTVAAALVATRTFRWS